MNAQHEVTRNTAWAVSLGLDAPIVCAPMGGAAGGALASAVSRAGGLGMIGMGSAASPTALDRELALLDTGGRPFGIGMVDWGIRAQPEILARAIAAAPALISVSFGDFSADPDPFWLAQTRAAGVMTAAQIASVDEARAAERAGVDVIVARGSEAGGHGDHQRALPGLLKDVLAAVEVPVLAAGALRNAQDVARVLDAGAAAAWVGTAFSACTEALTSDAACEVLFRAEAGDTLVSRVLDVALERPWPNRFPERLIRTAFVDRWHGREEELAADPEARAQFRAALDRGDYTVVPVDAGEGVGSLVARESAAEVLTRLRPH